MRWIERAWYYKHPLYLWWLWPLSCLFSLLTKVRKQCFTWGLKSSTRIPCPVIVVGNISVGGNGKTPLVLALARYLRQQGYKVGVLSRGYGGSAKAFPMTVEVDAEPNVVGDEPAMMKQRLAGPLVIDPDRVRGATYLCQSHHVDVIICDDGLQHYQLNRDIEIAVMDGQRRLGNGQLLPMGPLREGPERLKRVDYVVINGQEAGHNEVLMGLVPGQLVNIKHPERTLSVSQFVRDEIHLVAAIGNPQRFFDTLIDKGMTVTQTHGFVDHHQYQVTDIPYNTVIMTEKDAVKCRAFAGDDWWYLPVSAQLPEQFMGDLIARVKQARDSHTRQKSKGAH